MRFPAFSLGLVLPLAVVVAAGCSAGGGGSGVSGGNGGNGSGASGGSDDNGGGLGIGNNGGGGNGSGGGVLQGEPPCNPTDVNADSDGDGWTTAAGDCNDCTAEMNPGAYDFPGNNVDDDCDGTKDNEPAGCDSGTLNMASIYPGDALTALDLCRAQQGDSWGVLNVEYLKADQSPGMNELSHGLLPNFGTATPRAGNTFLALSSGTARDRNQAGYEDPSALDVFGDPLGKDMNTSSGTPGGFPVPSPSCPQAPNPSKIANDPAALRLRIKVPTNANAIRFDFMFYTYEFPEYICSEYNDFFVALMDPAPEGAISGNVSFDNQGNPVSVNNGYLEVCQAQMAGGKQFDCPQGTGLLQNTGFEPGASTGWLQTIAPVPPGKEVTLMFAIWDAGDHVLNSTAIIDNISFDVTDSSVPVTEPPPK
ncbi:MAG: putative metal-binding motif-containing protein [Myxococcales bacterium]|nr:putative metal-binding motif-containing protein [Myxococcales bacterium]